MSGPTRMDMARRMSGGYGTGEGKFGLAEAEESPAPCAMCSASAVLYFVESAEENLTYACLEHAAAVAYAAAVTSTAGPDVPASERGADDRRWRK
ncbi:hypothetical protein [Streptomyces murinus]|uniref:hypothetical protein n=1 Tax=Streptomyces murinus TaxID=33900 RepID=UPI0018F42A1E|nr:hypothetical protein [Streptomyces murinus]